MTENEKRKSGNREIPIREVSEFSVSADELRQRIAEKAYKLYQCRGCCHGRDLDDWLEAERAILALIEREKDKAARKPRSKAETVK